MTPDLGKYAVEVTLAYGVSLALLAGLILVSIRQSKKTNAALDAAEARSKADA